MLRPLRSALLALAIAGLAAGCSSAGPAPTALDQTETTNLAVTTSSQPSQAAQVGTDGGTLEEARARIARGESPKPDDLRFALLDEAGYTEIVEPRTGAAAIKAQGQINVTGTTGRFQGLGAVVGFTRDWKSANDGFTLREEAVFLTSPELATEYVSRLRTELAPLNIPATPTTVANVEYVVEFGVRSLETGRPCVSIAVARRDRVVTLATFSHACTAISGTWSALLSSYALERSLQKLGL